jgi:hypothetical protein
MAICGLTAQTAVTQITGLPGLVARYNAHEKVKLEFAKGRRQHTRQ